MIGKTQAARQPSIDDLLASIKQAIHERVPPKARPEIDARNAPTCADHAGPVTSRAASDAGGSVAKRTIVTKGHDGFSGLLGGDVRLEEALARLQTAGRRDAEEPGAADIAADEPTGAAAPSPAPKLRPTIDHLAGGLGSPIRPVAAQPAAARNRAATECADKAKDECTEERKDVRPHEPCKPWEKPAMHDEHRAPPRPAERPAYTSARDTPADLLSSQAASAAASAFGRLSEATPGRAPGDARRFDEITRECLRPLLKAWLDENLPGLVERLVREEIERVARPRT